MKSYDDFIRSKMKPVENVGFTPDNINPILFDFQKFIVTEACVKGRYAVFGGCGTGKTFMQLETARLCVEHSNLPAIIFAPLAVSPQTIEEGVKLGIEVRRYSGNGCIRGIYITNYEQLNNVDCSEFGTVILDESSILKQYTGKTKRALIESFSKTRYRFCFTATPSPNDYEELGNHSEFLGVLDSSDMRQRFFIRNNTRNEYRIKNHAVKDFFNWARSWSIMFDNPADIGFDGSAFILPPLDIQEHRIDTAGNREGLLFNDIAINATNFNKELRFTKKERLTLAANLANETPGNIIVWVKQNEEADFIMPLLKNAREVRGSDSSEKKEADLIGFARGGFKTLVTKMKIAQFGLNYQNCACQIVASLDFSFESFYQAVRRSWHFGQRNTVRIHVITTDTMKNVIAVIREKQTGFETMKEYMKMATGESYNLKSEINFRECKTKNFHIMNGDSVREIERIPDNSIDFSIFSPPFSTLYVYSNNIQDMGNCVSNEQFFEQYQYLLNKLYIKMRPGRLVAVHTKDLPMYKGSDGYTGIYDFTGDNLRAMEKSGFKYHSKITIWTDPVLEQERTKTQRLLYKQVRKDSSYSGVGLAEYLTIFRKWDGIDGELVKPIDNKNFENFPLQLWQSWASPVWMDIKRTDVLNGRQGTAQGDEKHICPLQLSVISRAILMWSNPGETVFTPFLGIGSEVHEAVRLGRFGIGIELKESYFDTAVKNCNKARQEKETPELFAAV